MWLKGNGGYVTAEDLAHFLETQQDELRKQCTCGQQKAGDTRLVRRPLEK